MTDSVDPTDADGFIVHRVDSGDEVLLKLIGELDVAGMGRLVEAATDLPTHSHVTVDLSELAFMDSTGIRVLMTLDLRSRAEQWTLTLHAPQPQVLNVLTLCGFENRFDISR